MRARRLDFAAARSELILRTIKRHVIRTRARAVWSCHSQGSGTLDVLAIGVIVEVECLLPNTSWACREVLCVHGARNLEVVGAGRFIGLSEVHAASVIRLLFDLCDSIGHNHGVIGHGAAIPALCDEIDLTCSIHCTEIAVFISSTT